MWWLFPHSLQTMDISRVPAVFLSVMLGYILHSAHIKPFCAHCMTYLSPYLCFFIHILLHHSDLIWGLQHVTAPIPLCITFEVAHVCHTGSKLCLEPADWYMASWLRASHADRMEQRESLVPCRASCRTGRGGRESVPPPGSLGRPSTSSSSSPTTITSPQL